MNANLLAEASSSAQVSAAERQVVTDNTYESVKAKLMDQEILPDARVSIDGLARDLGVSPTPVREALARLESDGLVVREAMRGYRATSLLTRDQLVELYEFRLVIEPWAAARAAERAGPDDRVRVATEMDSCTEVLAGSGYDAYRAIAAHDARFHDLLLDLSGNRQAQVALLRTHCHLHNFRLYYRSRIGTSTLAEHREITRAVNAADPDAARAAMRDHLVTARDRLLTAYT